MDQQQDSREEPQPKARKTTWRKRLALLAFSSLIAFTFGEFAARRLYGTPLVERLPIVRIQANPYRGWQMMPSEDHYTYQHLVEINSLGLRGPEVPARAENQARVLVLGDSLTYGQGVAEHETIPARLQAGLNESDPQGRDWVVINSGHRGYNTKQEVGVLQELGAQLDLDAVVLLWFWNDFNARDIQEVHDGLAESGPVCQDVSAPMEGRVKLLWHLVQAARRSALVMQLYDVKKRFKKPPYLQTEGAGLKRLQRDLDELKRLCDELDLKLMIGIIPEAGEIRSEHPSTIMRHKAMALMEENGVQVVPLMETVRSLTEEMGRLPVLPFDGHYDAVANEAMAKHLEPLVLELLAP